MTSAVRVLLLTAGLGTRLRPLTCVRAKAAVPVNGEALVRRIIRWLAAHGFRDLVLNLHHRPATISSVVGDGSDLGVRIRYSWEQPVLGSAGGPRRALPLLVDDPGGDGNFLIVNGDTLTDVDLGAVLAAHEASRAAVTMALIPNPRPDVYGGVQVSSDGWVTGFTRRGSPGQSYHFIGVQAARASVFSPLVDGVPAESVGALYPALIARDPRAVRAFVCEASFRDIGTPRDYFETSLALADIEGGRLISAVGTVIAASAQITRTIIWDDVRIGARARLTDCILADGVRIPEDARHEGCTMVRADQASAGDREGAQGGLVITRL